MTAVTHTPIKVVFPPGVLEDMEASMSPEDLQSFMDEVSKMAASGELTANSVDVDMDALEEDDPELFNAIVDAERRVRSELRPTLQ